LQKKSSTLQGALKIHYAHLPRSLRKNLKDEEEKKKLVRMIRKRILDYVKDCNNFLTFPISLATRDETGG
jgi:hypothetical protein